MAQSTQFRFAPFRLDPSRASLWRDAEDVVLAPKVFDLLGLLSLFVYGKVNLNETTLDNTWRGVGLIGSKSP
jgi:DNA-binding winged helix-turn-helix (wHTH) protein